MTRFKVAWKAFWNAWKNCDLSKPHFTVFWSSKPLPKKVLADLEAICNGKAHARTFPRRKQGTLREVV